MGKVKVIYSFRAILFVHVVLSLLVHSFAQGEKNPCLSDKHASKQVAKHFKFPSHFQQHMAVCGLFLRLGILGSHKTLEQNFIFQIGTLYPHGIKFILIFLVNMFKPIPWLNFLQTNNYITYNFSICSSEGLALETSALKLFKFTLSTPLIIPNYLVTLYH